MVIMGIDPGIAIVGAGAVSWDGTRFKPLYYGTVTTGAGMAIDSRLSAVYNGLCALLDKYKPDAVSIEQLFFNTNAKTAFAVGQSRGVLVLAAAQKGFPVFEYTPLQIKQTVCGYGRADKKQMQNMIKKILGLDEVPRSDDAADALAAAICHAHCYKMRKNLQLTSNN